MHIHIAVLGWSKSCVELHWVSRPPGGGHDIRVSRTLSLVLYQKHCLQPVLKTIQFGYKKCQKQYHEGLGCQKQLGKLVQQTEAIHFLGDNVQLNTYMMPPGSSSYIRNQLEE